LNHQQPTYWPGSYSVYAIGAALIAVLAVVGFFGTAVIPAHWLAINLGVVAAFFIALNRLSIRSLSNTETSFFWKLFWLAWLTRLVYMLAIVYLAEFTTGRQFYVGAVDATRYYRVAGEVAQLIYTGQIGSVYQHVMLEYNFLMDNVGVPLVLGFVFALFGQSVITAKVFFTIMGTGTVLLVYKTTRLLWDESVARLAGILMAIFPIALFYSSVILKEEFVVFLGMVVIYLLTKSVIEKRVGIWDLFFLLTALIGVFLFRSAAGVVLVSLVAGTYLMNRVGGSKVVSLFVSLIILGAFFWFMDVFGELDYFVGRVEGAADFQEGRVRNIQQGNIFITLIGTPVFVVLSFLAPFPSMVYLPIPFAHDHTYYWIGGLMIWNFLIWFGLIGLWKAFRELPGKSIAVWGYAAGYSIVLGITALFTAVRFGYNVMPMFMILVAVGIKYRDEFPYWKLYLIGAVFLIFAWNFVRLAGRGAF